MPRAFDGCFAHCHLKFALRIVSDSVRFRIAAAPNFIFHFSVIGLQVALRLLRSQLKKMRKSVQTWTSCALFVGYILTLPMHVQGFEVRAPQTCEILMQFNNYMCLGRLFWSSCGVIRGARCGSYVMFAGPFVCCSKQWGGLMLGFQCCRPSNCGLCVARGLGVRGEAMCG